MEELIKKILALPEFPLSPTEWEELYPLFADSEKISGEEFENILKEKQEKKQFIPITNSNIIENLDSLKNYLDKSFEVSSLIEQYKVPNYKREDGTEILLTNLISLLPENIEILKKIIFKLQQILNLDPKLNLNLNQFPPIITFQIVCIKKYQENLVNTLKLDIRKKIITIINDIKTKTSIILDDPIENPKNAETINDLMSNKTLEPIADKYFLYLDFYLALQQKKETNYIIEEIKAKLERPHHSMTFLDQSDTNFLDNIKKQIENLKIEAKQAESSKLFKFPFTTFTRTLSTITIGPQNLITSLKSQFGKSS